MEKNNNPDTSWVTPDNQAEETIDPLEGWVPPVEGKTTPQEEITPEEVQKSIPDHKSGEIDPDKLRASLDRLKNRSV